MDAEAHHPATGGEEVLDRWGRRIALLLAPDERDYAALITRTYAAGGAPRRELLATGGHAPGGAGGGLATLLPDLLDALAYGADAVRAVLRSQEFTSILAATALLAGLHEQRAQRSRDGTPGAGAAPAAPGPSAPEPPAPASGAPAPGTPAPAAPPRAAAAPPGALEAAARLRDRLLARGVPNPTAEQLACALVAELAADRDPSDAIAFLDRLVAHEPAAAPATAPSRSGRAAALRSRLDRLRRRRPGRAEDAPAG
ncbi:hypothetical protein [Streptomyces sp. NPDC093225]|uniref:hypothetical protein n=1 Tax=Streptomyces sp. NPDC093225 TaxID=3366034 RepID=UPI00380FF8C9